MTELQILKTDGNAIIDGLSYHYKNYLNLHNQLIPFENNDFEYPYSNTAIINLMKHEIIAYLNRMGQFYYFANSRVVSEVIPSVEKLIPTIVRFMPFRHKQAAHRATDVPRGENVEYMKQLDRLFTFQYLLINGRLWFQLLNERPHTTLNFDLLEEHENIIFEATSVVSKI